MRNLSFNFLILPSKAIPYTLKESKAGRGPTCLPHARLCMYGKMGRNGLDISDPKLISPENMTLWSDGGKGKIQRGKIKQILESGLLPNGQLSKVGISLLPVKSICFFKTFFFSFSVFQTL